jgi:hypothetical protein
MGPCRAMVKARIGASCGNDEEPEPSVPFWQRLANACALLVWLDRYAKIAQCFAGETEEVPTVGSSINPSCANCVEVGSRPSVHPRLIAGKFLCVSLLKD